MALKFLNKKGWHTGSLRNIENVWKAEQKHEAEQRKLEELRKQIHEERERAEFRQLQEQAGLISGQERLEFLYDSGLAVGKGSAGFKALESAPKAEPEAAASSSASAKPQSTSLGALFDEEEKPKSANDAWRKLTFDPLLSIRRSEQESLARIKNNPIQMDMIRKSVEAKQKKDKDEKKHKKKHRRKKSEHKVNSSSDNDSESASLTVEKHRESRHKKGSRSEFEKHSSKRTYASDDETSEGDTRRKRYYDEYKDQRSSGSPRRRNSDVASLTVDKHRESRYYKDSRSEFEKHSSKRTHDSNDETSEGGDTRRKKYYDEYKDRRPTGSSKRNDSEDASLTVEKHRENLYHKGSKSETEKHSSKRTHASDDDVSEGDTRRKKYDDEYKDRRPSGSPNRKYNKADDEYKSNKSHYDSSKKEYSSEQQLESRHEKKSYSGNAVKPPRPESNNRHRKSVKLTEEERAAKLKEMQMDAQRHEEQRWKRLKTAEEVDKQEAIYDHATAGRNFLDATQKSVYGAEKGGSSTIEESVRRRTHYSQRQSDGESNAFRRA